MGFVVFELWELNLLERLCDTTKCCLEGWGRGLSVPKLLSFLSCYGVCPRTDIKHSFCDLDSSGDPADTPKVNSNFTNLIAAVVQSV